jgi:hypothetical protein
MSISRHSDDQVHAREEVLLPLSVLGFVLASMVMGWCLFDHQRPNMPRATEMSDLGTPRK